MDTPQTWLPEKDRSLEDTISSVRAAAVKAGLDLEEQKVEQPVPGIWSIHLVEKHTGLYVNGKGRTVEAARASALGEFCERLGTGYFFAGLPAGNILPGEAIFAPGEVRVRQPSDCLDPALWDLYDPDGDIRNPGKDHDAFRTLLADAHTGHDPAMRDAGVLCLPFRSPGEHAGDILFPLNLLWNLHASNGLAAGNSLQEARIQAGSEICERHVRQELFRHSLTPPDIPVEWWPQGMDAIVEDLDRRGFGVLVRDASLGMGYPVVMVILIHRKTARVRLSFGAHPRLDAAINRTVTELFQGRQAVSDSDFVHPEHREWIYADPGNLESHFINSTGAVPLSLLGSEPSWPFRPWEKAETRSEEWKVISSILGREGRMFLREGSCLGLSWCHMVVPGVSAVYPVDELSWQNTSRFLPLRRLFLGNPVLNHGELQDLSDLMEAEAGPDHDSMEVQELLGLPLSGTAMEGLATGELRALLLSATGDAEGLADYLEGRFSWQEVAENRQGFWRALAFLSRNDRDAAMEYPGLFLPEDLADAAAAVGQWPVKRFSCGISPLGNSLRDLMVRRINF